MAASVQMSSFAATQDDIAVLEDLKQRGDRNGAQDLSLIDSKEVARQEPAIQAAAALKSPSTGVFDVAQWFRAAEGLLYDQGVMVLKKTPVTASRLKPGAGAMCSPGWW